MRKANYWLSLFMIGLMPWMDMLHLPGLGTVSRTVGLGVAAFWVLIVTITGKARKPAPFHLVALIFLLWTSVTIFWSYGVDRTWERMFVYIRMVGLAVVIWDLYESSAMIRDALQFYILGAYIHAGSVVYNFLLGTESVYGRYAGAGNIANTTAYVLGIGIPLAWYLATAPQTPGWHRRLLQWVNFAYFPAALTTIALTATRFGILMAIPACLYGLLVLLRARGLLAIVIVIVLVALLAFLFTFVPAQSLERLAETDDSIRAGDLTGRVMLWQIAQEAWEAHPIFGIGSDAFPSVNRSGRAVHNTYLVTLVENGVIGLAIYLVLLTIVFTTAWRLPGWESVFWLNLLVVWGVASLVLNLAHDKSIWLFFSLLITHARILTTERHAATVTNPTVTRVSSQPLYKQAIPARTPLLPMMTKQR